MIGRINSFESMGTVDGPGIRCVVFMQGCPLRCICCHNPDTWDYNGGEIVTTDELVKKILRFRTYFGTDGGVTVSGGEPLIQAKFVTELFYKLKQEGINTALDTSGCIFGSDVEKLLEYTDIVLLDHKYSNEQDYYSFTGGHLADIEHFLSELQKRSIPTWLRRVIIPGKNDDECSVKSLNDTAKRFDCVKKIELLPFRNLCVSKYDNLGIKFPLRDNPLPDGETMNKLMNCIDAKYR